MVHLSKFEGSFTDTMRDFSSMKLDVLGCRFYIKNDFFFREFAVNSLQSDRMRPFLAEKA